MINWHDLFEYRDGALYWKMLSELSPRHRGKRAGSIISSIGYLGVGYRGKIYLVHRVVWEMHNGPIPKKNKVDHINRDRVDNCIENLRLVNNKQNAQNSGIRSHANKTSKYKGVYFYKRVGKWISRIQSGPKVHCLGYFVNEDDAARAYNKKALELNGDYAFLNEVPHG